MLARAAARQAAQLHVSASAGLLGAAAAAGSRAAGNSVVELLEELAAVAWPKPPPKPVSLQREFASAFAALGIPQGDN